MKKIRFYFAALGFILGLIVHLISIFGIDITETVPFVWVLHLGIFLAWVPTVFDLGKNEELKKFQQTGIFIRSNPFELFKIIFKQAPTWLITIAVVSFFYAFLNFILFLIFHPGVPSIENGQYILHNHGRLIRTITEQEYHYYKASELRGFSGHWLLFYGSAVAALYPFNRKPDNTN